MPENYPIYINGQWIETKDTMPVVDKYSGEVFATVCVSSPSEVDDAVTSALRASHLKTLSPYQRYHILSKASRLILEKAADLALTITREAGKVFRDAQTEVMRAAQVFLIAAEEAKRISGEVIPVEAAPGSENRLAYTIRVPVGVVCAISPFNFPFNLATHKIAPALAAGNAVVLKPASATPISAINLCKILEEAGLPPGYLNLVVGGGNDVGDLLLKDERINFYTFTGSPPVGKKIISTIGLRKSTMELGSNSVTIIHKDADLTKAASLCSRMPFVNAGQVCISIQRLLIHQDIYQEFADLLAQETKKLILGNPLDPETDIGPMISGTEAARAEAWVSAAIQEGATLLCGGKRKGSLFEPTILTNVKADMQVVCEEIFAPVVSLIPYKDFAAAVEITNNSRYGLQAGIFTSSIEIAAEASRKLEVGGVIINDTSLYRADQAPYGGIKESGIGREGPKYAIQEMTESKLVVYNF
ncbi:NAD-dependent aldehyde dehydrogenase [Desulfosporosinus orientis DSM 765]|uniref:NAD-dependent aldehyde dehydrogenase n=1 Tax=Desulfosporosinus orientis (strain ATCC 19365 / DSM 765 / NCIMB 8382 / VKM B-1628 / Singapore I) TaxID=768706 RepID=G7WAN5_DESOD|nr:aldehyde dehydrogenase family protein [Desulfosporosinus orientis]AET66803.1 NAD-dependent aldehyde dehydrogenase [Desulfosporosinus orientis DSM 765]